MAPPLSGPSSTTVTRSAPAFVGNPGFQPGQPRFIEQAGFRRHDQLQKRSPSLK